MNMSKRQLRSGFCGIDVLVMVIIFAAIYLALTKPSSPVVAGGHKPEPAMKASPATQIAKEAARAGSTAMRANPTPADDDSPNIEPTSDPTTDQPPAAVPAADPTPEDAPSGDWLSDWLDDLFDWF